MPRIRTIKPEFWDSPGTARASLRARLFFIALWNWADDYGVGTANPKQLIGFAFPNDEEVTVAEFPRMRTEVAECYDVQWYEVGGRPYFAIPSWDDHQKNERRARGKNPTPDQADSSIAEMRGSSVQRSGNSGTGTGEQGNRGTGEQSVLARVTPTAELEAAFAHAYAAWPKKTERKQAFDRFKIAARRRPLAELVADIVRFGNAYAETTETKFVPALGVWIGHERWTDDLPAARAPRPGTAARPTRGQEHLAYIASLGEPTQQQEIER